MTKNNCYPKVVSCLALAFAGYLLFSSGFAEAAAKSGADPADNLPPHITRLTWFGERADWSHDGERILFVGKTYGDVYEIELSTKIIRPVTHHFYHGGFTRALYLANGDILLSGCTSFDAEKPHLNRTEKAELWVLDKSLTKPPIRLGEKCSEGPAVSRKNMKIAWTIVASQYPDDLKNGQSQIWMADIEYRRGTPRLTKKRLVLDNTTLDFETGLECQNFRLPQEKELIFSAYSYQGTEVMGVNLGTGQVVNYSNAPDQYDEPEGIFPDGNFTLVECDRQNPRGSQYIDIWKLKLDGSGQTERLTFFTDFKGYKSSNPVVSDDGKFMAFQMAQTGDLAGVGRGIFIYKFEPAQPDAPEITAAEETQQYDVVPGFLRLPPGYELGAVTSAATDSKGHIYVFNRGQHPIVVFNKNGALMRSFGDGLFVSPHGLRIDSEDNIWVTDNGNHTVTKFDNHGKALMVLGEKNMPGDDQSHFNQPTDVAFAKNGDFFVTDGYGNSRVVKFDRDGKLSRAWGKKGTGPGEFDLPHVICLDSKGNLYVSDRENNRVQVFDPDGKFIRMFGGFAPFGMFITPDDMLFVADGRANKVMKMDLEGKVLASWGEQGSAAGELDLPHGITVSADGAVFVTEINGKRVQKFVQR